MSVHITIGQIREVLEEVGEALGDSRSRHRSWRRTPWDGIKISFPFCGKALYQYYYDILT